MTREPIIKGGYILQPRVIEKSDISVQPPYVREIWAYLLREANSSDSDYSGFKLKRGQLFRSYADIREGTKWYVGWRKMTYNENHTKKAMKFLRETGRITTQKELGGVLITICKYDFYQDPKNYERTNERTNERTIAEPLLNHPLPYNNKNNKNDKNVKNDKKDNINISDSKKIESDNEIKVDPSQSVKTEKEKKKKSKGPSNPFHSHMKNVFMDYYQNSKGISYYWNVKDSVGINQLTKKIEFSLREGGKDVTEETVVAAFQFILEHNPDKWVEENLSPAILNSKYNEVIQKIKSGKSKQAPSDDGKQHLRNYRDQILRRMGAQGADAFRG